MIFLIKLSESAFDRSNYCKAVSMISPQYTPFSESEIRRVLRMTRSVYAEAVKNGALQRSVHFDCRVSDATSLHSLVDVVRYGVLFGTASGTSKMVSYEEQFDWWLDGLCTLDEESEELAILAAEGQVSKIMELLSPDTAADTDFEMSAAWTDEQTVFFNVVDSWCRYYRALLNMLVNDASLILHLSGR
jgi:hypothetical protein